MKWWVSPYINHFLQPDTIVPSPASPQSWNRYSYVGNNPIGYSDPTGHLRVEGCTELAGGCDITPEIIQRDLDKAIKFKQDTELNSYRIKCKGGDENYCPTTETQPGEVAGFVVTGLVAGPLAEGFILGGGMADALAFALLRAKLVTTSFFVWISTFFTRNPNSQTVSLGSFDRLGMNGYIEKGIANGYTYFQMNPVVQRILNAVGLAKPINQGFMNNQISQAKDFLVTKLGPTYGSGTLMEIEMLMSNGYARVEPIIQGFADFFRK